MPIEKKDARLTASVPTRYEIAVTRAAKREGKTPSELIFDMLTPFVAREEEYRLSVEEEYKLRMAETIALVNVNDISKGYVNSQRKAMNFKNPTHLRLVAS